MSALALTVVPIAQAGPFTIGNLAVVRVGDGSTTLTTDAAQVDILEFNLAGAATGNIIQLDRTGANAFTLSGTATTEGTLSGGNFTTPVLTLGGYNRDRYLSDPSVIKNDGTAGSVNRVVARVGYDGSVDVSTKLTAAYDGLSIKSATSSGTSMWTSGANGTSGGLRYVASVGASATTGLNTTFNGRQVQALNNQLFTGGSDTSIVGNNRSVFKVGTGLPTAATPTLGPSFALTGGVTNYNSFYFTNLLGDSSLSWIENGENTGFDTLYAITATGALAKYSYVKATDTWNANLSVGGGSFLNVAGITYGSKSVVLYATSSTGLYILSDTAGHNVNINASLGAAVATAGAGYAFRGIGIVPEPGSLALCGLAAAGLGVIARRRMRKPVVA